MKKIIHISLFVTIFFVFSDQAAANDDYFQDSADKFANGIINATTGWIELPKNIVLFSQKEGPLYGLTLGLGMGVMHTVGRSLVGIANAATFFIPTKPSINPLYVWDDFSKETTY